jgi:DNA-directed RNA polymerase subunit RPC12/RpoP
MWGLRKGEFSEMFCGKVKHIKKTKKEHLCVFCGRVIPVGKPVYSWFYSWGGSDNGQAYSCVPCENSKIIDRSLFFDGDIIMAEFFDELCDNDVYRCGECGNQRDIDIDWDDKGNLAFECDVCGHKWIVDYGWE